MTPAFVTLEQFAQLFPKVSSAFMQRYHRAFEIACREFFIDTRRRLAAFFAQVGHESGGLRYLEELGGPERWKRYQGRKDLGNVIPGDGVLFHGRGPIQLTGRANYAEFGKALGLPLEAQPQLALDIDIGARIAARYWFTHGCNQLADVDAFELITWRINGGLNGLSDRIQRWHEARRVLGLLEAS